MKTLLCVIAAICLLTLPVLAEEVKIDLSGRLAVGYLDGGKVSTNPTQDQGTFYAPDAKIKATAKLDADTTVVLRLDLDNGAFNSVDYAYVTLDNAISKLTGNKTVNPSIKVGRFKINFGEETWSNNEVEGALIDNSIFDVTGNDVGVQFDQTLEIDLPFILGYSVSLLNGNNVADDNNDKSYLFKVTGQLKDTPAAFSLSYYDSGKIGPATNSALNADGLNAAPSTIPGVVAGLPAVWYVKTYELDARYELEPKKFDPAKAPLYSDSKGVFRLAYGQATFGEAQVGKVVVGNVMLDGIYNVNDKWYVAFRYSYGDVAVDRNSALDGKDSRISVGGGHRLSDNTILKLTYSQNTEADTVRSPDIDNDTISLLITTKW